MKTQATIDSPYILMDIETGVIHIKGKSVMEDPYSFYKIVLTSLIDFIDKVTIDVLVQIEFEYFNTKSSLIMMQIFNTLKKIEKKGIKVQIEWYYDEDDEDIYECGIDYQSIIKLPFNIIEKRN